MWTVGLCKVCVCVISVLMESVTNPSPDNILYAKTSNPHKIIYVTTRVQCYTHIILTLRYISNFGSWFEYRSPPCLTRKMGLGERLRVTLFLLYEALLSCQRSRRHCSLCWKSRQNSIETTSRPARVFEILKT